MKKEFRIILVLVLFTLASCENMVFNPRRYSGENLQLLVASRESLLGVNGTYVDEVVVIDEDQYGRVVYGFLGYNYLSDNEVLAVGVIQTYNDQEVYYYDGMNMISKQFNRPKEMEKLSVSYILSEFNIDDIETLKAINDWGLQLKPEYFFETRIEKVKPTPIKPVILSRISHEVSSEISYNGCLFFTKDKNGLMLFIMQEYSEGIYGDVFLVMVNKNNEIVSNTGIYKLSVEQIENPWEVLNQFKVDNGWKFH